jgi:hypothetical protein
MDAAVERTGMYLQRVPKGYVGLLTRALVIIMYIATFCPNLHQGFQLNLPGSGL